VPTGDPQWCAGFHLAAIAVPTPFPDGTSDLTSVGGRSDDRAARAAARDRRARALDNPAPSESVSFDP